MTTDCIQLTVALASDGEPPREFRIFSRGEVRTRKGKFLFDDDAARAVMTAVEEHGVDYSLDYAHAMFAGGLIPPADPAEAHKAAGWFKPQLRDGELWATDVTWTPKATQKLKDREFRYMSPTFKTVEVELADSSTKKKARRIVELMNVALTNVPATDGIAPLMASQGAEDSAGIGPAEVGQMKTIAVALGLSGDASESAVLERVTMQQGAFTELGRETGKSDLREMLSVIQSWKRDAAEAVTLRDHVARVERLSRERDVKARIEAKITGGFVTPAERDHLVELGMEKGVEKLDAYLGTRTIRVVPTSPLEGARPSPVVHDVAAMPGPEWLSQNGLTQEKYLQTLALMQAEGSI